jgi:uncharacterized membrane protein
MTPSPKTDWLLAAGLIVLSLIPMMAGTVLVVQLSSGGPIAPNNARFFAAPWPVVLHIVSAVVYSVLGAFQFVPHLRRSKPHWHRAAGRILVPCGLVVALTGLWMTQFYPRAIEPPASFDGPVLYAIRLLAGSAMAVFLCLGFAAVRKRDIAHHRVWMMRAYALGLGAGTQVFTHIPWFLLPSIQGELARTLCMGAGWAINLAVAEWFISRQRFMEALKNISN